MLMSCHSINIFYDYLFFKVRNDQKSLSLSIPIHGHLAISKNNWPSLSWVHCFIHFLNHFSFASHFTPFILLFWFKSGVKGKRDTGTALLLLLLFAVGERKHIIDTISCRQREIKSTKGVSDVWKKRVFVKGISVTNWPRKERWKWSSSLDYIDQKLWFPCVELIQKRKETDKHDWLFTGEYKE